MVSSYLKEKYLTAFLTQVPMKKTSFYRTGAVLFLIVRFQINIRILLRGSDSTSNIRAGLPRGEIAMNNAVSL